MVRRGHRAVLYATTGAQMDALSAKAAQDLRLVIRVADFDLLRRSLTGTIEAILTDTRTAPAERSRQAYHVAMTVMAPLFTPETPLEEDGLDIAHEMIDLLTRVLDEDDESLWSMVAVMQKHMATHSHAMNTALYGLALAKRIGMTVFEELRDVGRGSILHDIGKVKISATILDKPGPLTKDEWRIMRTHPAAGYDMIVRAMSETPSYAHIVAEHHERADGSGYPLGRRSGQVAQDSMIVAIADAFDAITSKRPYKDAESPFEALRIMRFAMAGQFHDELLREFIALLGGWQGVRPDQARELRVLRSA
jgi:putative nucleotidyltransferase with HDIG domain